MDQNINLPEHVPIDMAYAPNQKPYSHTPNTHMDKVNNQTSKLSQHSLSPEKLGVVGYVKDVAGFVRDVVNDKREKRKQHEQALEKVEEKGKDVNLIDHDSETKEIHRDKNQAINDKSKLLSNAITGLFPGVHTTFVNGTHCTHVDELRNQMILVNEQQGLIHKHI